MGRAVRMAGKQVCLVLGAGSGIGYSVARQWAKMGHQVVITRRSQVSQEDLDREAGAGVVAMQCDVTNKEEMEKVVNEVESKCGPIGTLIYNAGNGVFKNYANVSISEFEKCMAINTSAFAPAKAAQRMLAQSLARDLGPKNVHVFYTIIDGLVKAGTEEKSKYMDPDHIAETYWNVASQKGSAWTFEVDMRPF